MMIDTLVRLVVAMLTTAGPLETFHTGDLEPKATRGRVQRVQSAVAESGELLQWTGQPDATLQLKFRVEESGTYQVSLFAVHIEGGATISARLWDDPITMRGEADFTLRGTSDPLLLAVEFDPVSMEPGYHFLELSRLAPGDVMLERLSIQRTGEPAPRPLRKDAGRPFLGVEIGGPTDGGVKIDRAVPGTAAAEAGIQADDVILRIDGKPMTRSNEVLDAILRHHPGDRIEVTLLRDDAPLELTVTLGRRSEATRRRESRASIVLDFLKLGPDEVIADIGCGSGWLSEAIAQSRVDGGLVYAVEIDEKHVRRMRSWSIPSVVAVFSAPDDVALPENTLDTAMLHDVASHVKRSARPRFYESVVKALKPGGRLVVFGPHGKGQAMLDDLQTYGFAPVNADELAAMSTEELDKQLWAGIQLRYVHSGDE